MSDDNDHLHASVPDRYNSAWLSSRCCADCGYPVVVSEAEPLPALDCGTVEHRQLAGPTGGGRTASKQQAEWLTIYRP